MAKKIDLGRKFDDELAIPDREWRERVHYPDLYLSDIDDPALLDMPDEGTCTINYKIVGRNHSENERDGKKERRCSITMEIHSIEPPAEKASKNGNHKKDSDGGARKAFSDYFKDK